ncbi:MAG: hypothetical protein ACM3NQ_09845 [Bacteroidales bacterium]
MANKKPKTALELRERCRDCPEDIVRQAVVAAFRKARPTPTTVLPLRVTLLMKRQDRRGSSSLRPDDARVQILACFVAEWLTDRELPKTTLDNPPRLSPHLIAAIWRHLDDNRN